MEVDGSAIILLVSSKEKIKELEKKKKEIEGKLDFLYKHFRGVIHEDSSSEMKYTQIKVYEDFLRSINNELDSLKKKN